jgi:hypothetical protein
MLATQEAYLLALCADFESLTPNEAIVVIHNSLGPQITLIDAQCGKLKWVIKQMLEAVHPENPLFDPTEVDHLLKEYLLTHKHEVKHINLKPLRA